MVYYVRDKYVRSYDINTGADIGLLSVRKFGSPYVPPRTLSFNPAERSVILTISSDNGIFELAGLPKDAVGEVKDSSVDGKRGTGQSAIFVARNRFAILNKTTQVSSISMGRIYHAHVVYSSLKSAIFRIPLSKASNRLFRQMKSFMGELPA